MKPDEELLISLQNDVERCKNYFRQVTSGIIKGEISKYPIIVAIRHEIDLDLGIPIINKEELELDWTFCASHLEEFVSKNVVQTEKVKEFIANYKPATEYLCIFLAEEGFTSFIFMPYQNNLGDFGQGKELLN